MRFMIEYNDYKTKEVKNINLELLEIFLNEHCIGKYHGDAFECIILKFLNNFTSNRKLTCKKLYDHFAVIEMKSDFKCIATLDLQEFTEGFFQICQELHQVNYLQINNKELKFQELLTNLKNAEANLPSSIEQLNSYENIKHDIKEQNHQKRINCLIQSYKDNPKDLDTRIKGIRIYPNFLNAEDLLPYEYIYSQIFGSYLRMKGLKLPGYQEIYISIAESMEQAKKQFALVEWHKYTYSTLDIEKYNTSDGTKKEEMVVESISSALRFMADFDHLNENIIEDVISLVKNQGSDIELICIQKESESYIAQVSHKVPKDHMTRVDFMLKITDKASGKSGVALIDQLDLWWAPYSIGKLEIKKDKIVITGRKSLRAEISRDMDNLPDKYIFKITDLIGC